MRTRSWPVKATRWVLLIALLLGFVGPHATVKAPPYQGISVADSHSCLLQGDGTVSCFGANNEGQSAPPPGVFKQISAGEQLSCGVRSDDSAVCWGWNVEGQAEAPTGDFKQVSAGYFFACGIHTNDTLRCWGRPTVPPDVEGFYTQVSAGYGSACAVRSDGNVDCWGLPSDDEDGPYVQVEVTIDGTACARRSDGSLKCWGYDGAGVTTPPPGAYARISAGAAHYCGLRTNQTLACWGANEFGEINAPSGTYLDVAAGWNHSCAIRTDGTLDCWGYTGTGQNPDLALYPEQLPNGFQGQLYEQQILFRTTNPADWLVPYTPVAPFFVVTTGTLPLGMSLEPDGTLTGRPLLTGEYTFAIGSEDANGFVAEREYVLIIEPASANRIVQVSTGYFNTCVLRASGALNCFGIDYGYDQNNPPPGPFKRVDMGDYHSCGLRTDDMIQCWGYDFYGQSTLPSGAFRRIDAGPTITCAIDFDDDVTCWGFDNFGAASAPIGDFAQVSSGYKHSCGVRTNGALDCWGYDFNGIDPAIDPAGAFLQVSVGVDHDCAVRDDYTLYCWGRNDHEQSSPPPGQFQFVSVGHTHSCALSMDATLTCWGFVDDVRYPLGVPTPPTGLFDQFDTGIHHMCGLRKDGSVACWGNNGDRAPILEVAPASLPEGEAGEFYSQQLSLGPDITSGGYAPVNPSFAVIAGDLPQGITLSLDGLLSGTPLYAGPAHFTVYGTDANGIDAQREYVLVVNQGGGGGSDNTPPVIAPKVMGTTGENGWYIGPVSISWSVVDNESTVTDSTGCNDAELSTDVLDAGFTCTATSAGGTGSQTVHVSLDGTAPDTQLTSGPSYFDDDEASFTFEGIDDTSGIQSFECMLDGADYAACTSPLTLQLLADGVHVVSIRAVDFAGNRDATPAQQLWIVGDGDDSADSISAGFTHACRIRPDGTLGCWGSNDNGQATPPFGVFREVEAGGNYTCAIRLDGTIACFGPDNSDHTFPPPGAYIQISAGFSHTCAVSVMGALACWGNIPTPPPGLFLEVQSGTNHSCAIAVDSHVECWGENNDGKATAPPGQFLHLALGTQHSCGIRADRTLECWGLNNFNQLVTPPGAFKRINAHYEHTCGIRDDDAIVCWGRSLAIGSVPIGAFKDVSPGGFHNCAVRMNDTVVCWGSNNAGQAPRPTIQPPALTGGATGVAYDQAMTMVDTSTYVPPTPAFAVIIGTLPAGFDLDVDGTLSGTPGVAQSANFTIEAEDANGFVASRAYTLEIVEGDTTAPVIVPTIAGTLGNNGWYRSTVTVTWSVNDPESGITSSTGCNSANFVADTAGETLTCEATSVGGTSSESVIVRIDRAAPILAPSTTPDPLLLNAATTGNANATDATSGVALQACGPLNTATVGSRQVSCSATDAAGNTASAPLNYRVVYGFTNFNLATPPSLNRIGSGKQTVLRWRLVDANGNPVTTLASASVENPSVICSTTGASIQDAPLSSGNTKLQNLGNGNYALNWKVPRVKATACLEFDLVMGDDNDPRINFLILK